MTDLGSTQPSTVGGCFGCMSSVVWDEDGLGKCKCEGQLYRKHQVYMEGPVGNWEWRETYTDVGSGIWGPSTRPDFVVQAEEYKWVCRECLGMLTVDSESHGSDCPWPECGGRMKQVQTFDGWLRLREEMGVSEWTPKEVLRLRAGLDYVRTLP